MEDVFAHVKEGRAINLRLWLDNTANDLAVTDDHRFSLLHWAAAHGHVDIAELLISRGAKVDLGNMGEDTPLHLAASHGHRDLVNLLVSHGARVNAVNEHGNSPLHYACFWSHVSIAADLVQSGARLLLSNRFGETPLSKCRAEMASHLRETGESVGGVVMQPAEYSNRGVGTTPRAADSTLRAADLELSHLNLKSKICESRTAEYFYGKWQGTEIVAKRLRVPVNVRTRHEFALAAAQLRVLNCANVLPVLGAVKQADCLMLVTPYLPNGSLYNQLHGHAGAQLRERRVALDIARGCDFLLRLQPPLNYYHLSSKAVMIDSDLTARLNLAKSTFPFLPQTQVENVTWRAPETLLHAPGEYSLEPAHMWSFAIICWELSTRRMPYQGLSTMEIGMKVALEGLRPEPLSDVHTAKLVGICLAEEPARRPTFPKLLPVLEKMVAN